MYTTMTMELMIDWMNQGNVSIPRILLMYYKDLGLTEKELVVLLQLQGETNGRSFPNFENIAEYMQCSRDELFTMIHELINKKIVSIKTIQNNDGKSQDIIKFDQLYEKLYMKLNQTNQQHKVEKEQLKAEDLYRLFEQEFGRALSPLELDTLNMWIDEDNYKPELIQMALKEAVLNQVYSLKYIDRILYSWEKKNIRTKDQVLKATKQFRQAKNEHTTETPNKSSNKSKKTVPLHDWLRDIRRD